MKDTLYKLFIRREASGFPQILSALLACVIIFPSLVAASPIDFTSLPCSIIKEVYTVIEVVVPTLVLIMFTYGGIKYVMSADDPGGRKQAKTICQSAVIGGILFLLLESVKTILASALGSLWGLSRCI